MEDRGVCKIDNTCTGKKDCKVYRKQSKRYKTEETAEDVCDLYGQCQHFNNCSGRCYWDTGMCPCVETCDETRTFEFIANAIAVITLILMLALVPIIFIAGVIALLWAIFAI